MYYKIQKSFQNPKILPKSKHPSKYPSKIQKSLQNPSKIIDEIHGLGVITLTVYIHECQAVDKPKWILEALLALIRDPQVYLPAFKELD